ncbi:hypothetical protein ACFSB1_17820 [Halopseudomonas phragmitis]|uniref:hypothetical protein n=1 Tax=Halopseudomonas phragmitis TaxID=1931241 RepID=UPI0012BAF426|nr:hypothetical protein [Halopseudomonas phragmitis]
MSPLLIGALVIGGLLILISIGFINHSLERARLERARQVADLNARLNVCDTVSIQLPGQFMSPELKSLLLRLEVQLLEQLVKVDRKNDSPGKRLDSTRQQLSSAEPEINNPPLKVTSEAQAKDVRLMLENLHKLLTQAHKDGLIDKPALQRWSAQIRQFLINTALELFQSLAEQAMRQGKPRLAKLQYERAISYLQKHNNPAYTEHLQRLKHQHQQAEQLAAQHEHTSSDDNTELAAGLKAMEESDEAWKKKAVYDD